MVYAKHNQITFDDKDIVNMDEWIPDGEYNPHNIRPWLLHDHGFSLAVVFASNLKDALDEAADHGNLDSFKVSPQELHDDYDNNEEHPSISYLGNASEMFDIETVESFELPNPKQSFVGSFNNSFG